MVLFASTNSPAAMPPAGGRTPILGTNPIAWGFPGPPGSPPIVIDLATSHVARGHIIQAARLGQPIPEGWAVNAAGEPTTDAQAALEGAVLPMAGAKGWALAVAMEILTAVLSGAGIGPEVLDPYRESSPSNVGHFFLALDPSGFRPPDEWMEALTRLANWVHGVQPAGEAPVRLPGERSAEVRARYLNEGIPLDAPLVAELNDWASRLDLSPLPIER
jgi:LDH2 family malate/lactate/ureidoglycolate dehydrogenase